MDFSYMELLKGTGWKTTIAGAVISILLMLIKYFDVEELTLKDIVTSIEPLLTAFLINNKLFR